jgi:L-asparaginase / beta-aspartyl-peptidase
MLLSMSTESASDAPRWVLAIHGGASGLPHDLPDAELEAIRDTLGSALETGAQILASGGSSLDAVQSAVRLMENSGVLNAGRGAVLNHEGFAELDAAIIDGKDRRAGCVAALRHVANPIDLARLVMDRTACVMLVGEGAEQFAREQDIAMMPASYFITERRRRQLERVLQGDPASAESAAGSPLGTVGAVALDTHGNLAAATSTGGFTNKHVGRVGDSPIIGAGTYAENGVCAVSATGMGEIFMRFTAASEVCARVKYKEESLGTAASEVIQEFKAAGGEGGMIALDAAGNIAMPYSSALMLRGQVSSSEKAQVLGLKVEEG